MLAILPSAVGAAQPPFVSAVPAVGGIQLNEPGDPAPVLHLFAPLIAIAFLLNWLNESPVPPQILCLFVHYTIIEFLLNALDVPAPSVLHAAVPVQPDVLHVDALPLHIFPAAPNPGSDWNRHEHDSSIIDGI